MKRWAIAGSRHGFQTKFFKTCYNLPPKLIYSPWRVSWISGFADEHSPWRVMKLAMASCPEIRKIITFVMKSTGFIMVNPIKCNSDPDTTQRWTESQLIAEIRIFALKPIFWKFEIVDLIMGVTQIFALISAMILFHLSKEGLHITNNYKFQFCQLP